MPFEHKYEQVTTQRVVIETRNGIDVLRPEEGADINKVLAERTAEGWELVSGTEIHGGGFKAFDLFWKRQTQ